MEAAKLVNAREMKRFSWVGGEKVKRDDNQQDYGMRMYNPSGSL